MGGCCLDTLAQVATFPEPDTKLRTERMEVGALPAAPGALPAALPAEGMQEYCS